MSKPGVIMANSSRPLPKLYMLMKKMSKVDFYIFEGRTKQIVALY